MLIKEINKKLSCVYESRVVRFLFMKPILLITLLMISRTEENKMFAVVQLQAHNHPDGIIRYINRLFKSRYE